MARSDQLTASHRRKLQRWANQIDGLFDTSTGHTHDGSDSASISAGANTLQEAYDQGGAGSGRAIVVNSGAVTMGKTDAGTENVLEVTANPSAGADGDAILVTVGSSSTGVGIQITNGGSGNDIAGTSDTWTVSKLGVAVFDSINTVGVIKIASDTLGTGSTMIGYDGTDLIVNALTGKSVDLQVNDVAVITAAGSAITLAQATTISTGGLTVDAGGITVTGNSIITGTLSVTGDIDWGGTLTTDELILDSDGVPPAGTFVYLVSDQTGDLTLNAKSSKEIHLAINSNDEYDFNATAFQLASANDIQFLGDDGILDSGGNELIQFTATGSAVNYLQIINAATGDPITLQCLGTDDKGFVFEAVNDEEILELGAVTDALNFLKIISSASTNPVTIQTGGTANMGIDFENSEGEEMLQLVSSGTDVNHIVITSVAGATTRPQIASSTVDVGIIFTEGSSPAEEMLELIPVSTAVNHITITSAASGNAPVIATSTADIGIIFADGSGTAEEMLVLENIATATDYINIKSGDSSTHPTISVVGDTGNIDMLLTTKGTGAFVLNSGTDPVIIQLMGAQAGFNNEIHDVNGAEIMVLQGVASATGELTISNAVNDARVLVGVQTTNTNAGLSLDTAGTGNLLISLGGIDALVIDDSAITLAAAGNTAGHALFMQTEDGGTATSQVGLAGGAWEIRTGDGTASDLAGQAGGAGGALTLVSGIGLTGNAAGAGGAGGDIAITAGAGGAAGTGLGGDGGDINLTPGAGGAVGGGTIGAPGQVSITTGVLAFSAQIVDMSNGALTLTLDPGDTAGTLVTSNVLLVDPNGGAQNLLMPKEAPATGIIFYIANDADAAENINLQDDGGGGIGTIGQNEVGMVVSDGTNWHIFVGIA